jgi:hypothetical protein
MSRPTILHVGSTLFWELLTFDPDAPGVLKDADSTPTVTVRKNGAATGDSVTVTKRAATTGLYDCVYDPADEVESDSFQIRETMIMTGSTTSQKTYHNSFHVTVLATASDVSSFIANSIENNTNNWDAAIPVINAAVLAAIQGSEVIQVASPNVLGNLVLTQGDDYDGVANPRAQWTVTTDYTTGWTVRLTIRDTEDAVVYTNTGSVVSSTVVAVTIAAPTGLTMTGCPGQWQGKFDVELTHSSGKKKTIALGVCYINEDQTR